MASLVKRSGIYYAQISVAGKVRRQSLRTRDYQMAKEKIRQIESRLARGDDNPLPTRTPIPEVIAAYVRYIRDRKTAKSAQTDISYLRQIFSDCCPELENSARRIRQNAGETQRQKKTRRKTVHPIHAECFERISTAQISDFISELVRSRGLAPKTANRYREILTRLFNWAMLEGRVRLPGDVNPAARVKRYRERAPEISFLTLPQIDEQLRVLRFKPRMHAMVATLIYAGLRREELLWLQADDLAGPSPQSQNGMIRLRAKTVGGVSWQPKTGRNRAIPISSSLRTILDQYVIPASDHDWVFPSPKGTRWDPDNFSADLRAANKVAGLKWGSLDYRHTFGSQLAQRGVSLFQISALMGNSPEICRRHYAALVPEAMGAVVEFGNAKSTRYVDSDRPLSVTAQSLHIAAAGTQ